MRFSRAVAKPYGIAIAAVAVAIALRIALQSFLGEHLPYVLLFPIIWFVGWQEGVGPALVSLSTGTVATIYLMLPPHFISGVSPIAHKTGLFLFLLVSCVIIALTAQIRRATRRVQASAERLGLALDAGRLGVWEVRLRDREVSWSESLAQICGLPQGTFTGTIATIEQLIHPEDRVRVLAIINESIERCTVHDVMFRIIRPDGVIRWLHNKGKVICSDAGQALYMLGFAADVTEQQQAIAALRESESRLAAMLEHVPAAMFIKDRDGRYIKASRYCQAYTGLAVEDLIGKTDADFFDKELVEQLRHTDQEILLTAEPRQYEETLRCAGQYAGSTRTFFTIKFPLPDASGLPSGVCGIATDITERRQAEEERRRADEIVHALLRITARLSSTLDVDELLDSLTNEAIALIGAEGGMSGLSTGERMVSRRYFQRGKSIPWEHTWAPQQGLPGRLLVHRVPYLCNDVTADPTIKEPLYRELGVRSVLATPILDAQGDLIGFCEIHNKTDAAGFISTDQELLTSVSQSAAIAIQNALAFRRIQQAEAALRDADRRKDEFLAVLAHELRNPLAPIRTALELLRFRSDDRDVVEHVQGVMERQVGQMVRLIDDLLDVSRIARGKLELRRERIELAHVVQTAIEISRPLIDAMEHRLIISLPDSPLFVDGDMARLAQIFANLLNNAAKYTPKGGLIHVTAEQRGQEIITTVSDTGVGIAKEHLGSVFAMFAQVAPHQDQTHGGLGIGLALSRALVEMHGGRIFARSGGLGMGSEFVVRLNACSAAFPQEVEKGTRLYHHQPMRVLVVDDNQDTAKSLEMLLGMLGHVAHSASDGVEALAKVGRFQPDVVILDITMPRMNGYEVARQLRKQLTRKRLVLIALTGWGSSGI